MTNQNRIRVGYGRTPRYSSTVHQTHDRPLNDPARSTPYSHGSLVRSKPRRQDRDTPAVAPRKLFTSIKRRWQIWSNRHRLQELLTYDDRILAGMGQRREDLSRTLQQPSTLNAANDVPMDDRIRSSSRRRSRRAA